MTLKNVKKIKGCADKNGLKNVTCKQGLMAVLYITFVRNILQALLVTPFLCVFYVLVGFPQDSVIRGLFRIEQI